MTGVGRCSGSRSGFDEFVAARQRGLLRTAYLLCGDWHLAEDLVQSTLAKLYVAWPRVERAGSPEAYARTVLVHAAVDEHRRPWRREQPTGDLPETPETPVDETARTDERLSLVTALGRLSRGQRAVVVLRFVNDLDIATTAEILGCSPGTVKSQSFEALRRLRQELAPATPKGASR